MNTMTQSINPQTSSSNLDSNLPSATNRIMSDLEILQLILDFNSKRTFSELIPVDKLKQDTAERNRSLTPIYTNGKITSYRFMGTRYDYERLPFKKEA